MSKFRSIVENILTEAKQVGILYHNTPNLYGILKSNKLEGYFSIGISFDKHEGWFNDRGWNNFSYFTLILNGDKLSENYKLIETNRTKGEVLAIPPHQEIKTYRKELNKTIENLKKDYDIPDKDMERYIFFKKNIKHNSHSKEERELIERLINSFEMMYFDRYNPKDKENLIRLEVLIDTCDYMDNDKLEHDLREPLIVNNLNEYLIGLIVRYPFKREILYSDYSDNLSDEMTTKQIIQNINNNIKIFKEMYPNLPVYLRDEKGHKALLKNNQINQLPEIKAVNYKGRTWRDREIF